MYLLLKSSNPYSTSFVFTISLIIGAVRYSTLSFLSSFQTSVAISKAVSWEAPVSSTKVLAIFAMSNGSILSLEERTFKVVFAKYLLAASESTSSKHS